MLNVNAAKLTSSHFYAWKKGLKTGCYYLRTKAAVDAIQFTVDQAALEEARAKAEEDLVCSLDNKEACMSCGS